MTAQQIYNQLKKSFKEYKFHIHIGQNPNAIGDIYSFWLGNGTDNNKLIQIAYIPTKKDIISIGKKLIKSYNNV